MIKSYGRFGAVKSLLRASALAVVIGGGVAGFSMPAHAALSAPLQQAVSAGKQLFMHATFGGSGRTCATCHQDAGRGPTVMPNGKRFPSIANAAALFPRYKSRTGRVITLEDQLRGCVRRGLGGQPPAYGSKTMNDLVAYITYLAQGKPINMGGSPK